MYKIEISNSEGEKAILFRGDRTKSVEVLNAISNMMQFTDPFGTCYIWNGLENEDIKIEMKEAQYE